MRASVVSTGFLAMIVMALPSCSSPPTGSSAGSRDGGGDSGCTPYVAPAVSVLQTPTTSFMNDVLPIFVFSCTFSGCHNMPTGQLEYLGNKSDPPSSFAQQVYSGTVGQLTIEAPTLMFVVAGDPAQSFLMRKLDDDLCSIQDKCAANSTLAQRYPSSSACGVSMPQALPLLDVGKRDTIRRWIAQGAQNN